MTPRVLALVPVFNPAPADLHRSLQSLLDQSRPIDICLIDDGSDVAVSRHVSPVPGLFHLRLDTNSGIARALNAGIAFGLERRYDYFCRLDAGDIAYPDRVARQLAHMEAHRDIALLGAFADVSDPAENIIGWHGVAGGPNAVRRYLFKNAAFKHSTFLLRASAVDRLGAYDTDFCGAEDYELALRYAAGGQVDCLTETLIDYVDDPKGFSTRKRGRQLRMRLKAQLRHMRPLTPPSYLGIVRTLVLMVTPHPLAKRLSLRLWRSRLALEGL